MQTEQAGEIAMSSTNKFETTLLASVVALGLSTGAAFAASSSPNGGVSAGAKPPVGVQTAQRFNRIAVVPATRDPYVGTVAPSRSNPTGQVEYGANGTISLYAPTDNGGG
jgi:hypothetical protein